ncbi:selenocysteine-specific translation elongation factor [Enterococcus hirae]
MANIVIGTAGHIDHGKTTLIKALTGIDTDTTKEEKKRGMSINLGFAYLNLPNQQRVGFVDVPGHEKFIKNMVAGLPGLNLILLVIDASEGIMPQTKEHIDILNLLGIHHFLIVLTKIDTIDAELKELVIEDIRDQLLHTPLEKAEIIETDAISGKGIKQLLKKIEAYTEQTSEQVSSGTPRLNIDRVFSVKGFGTVVTGTLLEGELTVGENCYLYPNKRKVRIRNLQVHENNVQKAYAGQRTAINLANITREEVMRGDVLSTADSLEESWMLDVKVSCLAGTDGGISLWDRVRVLIGTKEVMARTVPLGLDWIGPNEEGFLQLRLEEKVSVKEKDRFILRSYSPMHTIAGGEVLNAVPKKHRRFKQAILESLKAKENGNLNSMIIDVPGIAGLAASVGWLMSQETPSLGNYFYQEATKISELTFYGDFTKEHIDVFSLNIRSAESALISDILWEEFGIATRSGYHCSPLIHQDLGTKNTGTVRVSLSRFTTEEEIEKTIKALRIIAKR